MKYTKSIPKNASFFYSLLIFREYDNQWKANKRKADRLRAKSEELYVKLSDSQVSTNLIDSELSGINQITELDQTSFDEIMTESKGSYNGALQFMVNSGLFREEALSIVERYLNMDEDDSNEYCANLQSSNCQARETNKKTIDLSSFQYTKR